MYLDYLDVQKDPLDLDNLSVRENLLDLVFRENLKNQIKC
jgi:hypothetical protein